MEETAAAATPAETTTTTRMSMSPGNSSSSSSSPMPSTSTTTTKTTDRMIQVTNIAPNASLDQMRTMFSFIGDIDDIVLYPDDDNNPTNQSKVCFIRFKDPISVPVSQHLTNTVFIDRAIIVQAYTSSYEMPDAATAMSQTSSLSLTNGGSNSGLISQIVPGVGGAQVISTIDPRLSALGLPQYPPLPANTDPSRVEEIRRTIYVGNMDSKIPSDLVMEFFNSIGEVKYVRMAGDESQPTRFAFVEFTDQSSVANALQYNGVSFAGRPLKINHSNNAIVKHVQVPAAYKNSNHSSAAGASSGDHHHHHNRHQTGSLSTPGTITQHRSKPESIEDAMKRVREAESQIAAAIDYPAPREKSLAAQDPERRRREEERKLREQERAARHNRDRSSRDRDRDSHRDKDRDRDRNGKNDHRDRDRDRDRDRHHHSSSRSSRRSRSRDRVSDTGSKRDKRSSPAALPASYNSRSSPPPPSLSSSSSHHRRSSKRDRSRSRDRDVRRSEKRRSDK